MSGQTKKLVSAIFLFLPLLATAQRAIEPEWVEMDSALFEYFFANFPLNPETTKSDLVNNLDRFKDSMDYSIGFGGKLYWWILPGGTVTLNTNIVTFKGKVVALEMEISNDDLRGVHRLFRRDKTFKDKFLQYFTSQVNPHYFQDSVYIYKWKNDPIFDEYSKVVGGYLGEQQVIDVSPYAFEYNLLNKPTGNYFFSDYYFGYSDDYPPVYATRQLVAARRSDCLLNIIRGYSLPGRMYGITGLLLLVEAGFYSLTDADIQLINRVLEMDLTVEGGSGLVIYCKYRDCLDEDLLELIGR